MSNKKSPMRVVGMVVEKVTEAMKAEETFVAVDGAEALILEGYRIADNDTKAKMLTSMASLIVARELEEDEDAQGE